MIHLIRFLIKVITTIILSYAWGLLMIISLILWDIEFLRLADKALKRIWHKENL